MEQALMKSDAMKAHIATIDDLNELMVMRVQMNAAQDALKKLGGAREGLHAAQNELAENKIRIDRRMGELTMGMKKGQGTRTDKTTSVQPGPKLKSEQTEEVGLKPATVKRNETIAKMPTEAFETHIAETKASGAELTQAGVLRVAKKKSPVAKSGDDEWYTPRNVLDCVRAVMGRIDLDPASNDAANEVVGAAKYYTQADNGLAQEWHGKVFLNPPYKDTNGDTGKRAFIAKLVEEYRAGNVIEACLVCPIDFSPRWGDPIREHATAICPSKGNFKFWKADDPNATPQGMGSMLVYFGDNPDRFAEHCETNNVGRVFIGIR